MTRIFNLKSKEKSRKKLRAESTVQEILLWSRIRRKQLGYKFRRQHSIGKYIVDFYCSDRNLIVELDGWQHKQEDRALYDQIRTKFLESIGCTVLRFDNNDVNDNMDGVILKIEQALKG